MAIPLLRNLSDTTTNKKYQTYKDSLVYASKLYVDSYAEDLFDNRDSGCAYIDIESLIERKLISDIEIDDISCEDGQTYIQVIKAGDKYTFSPYLKCGPKKENGKIGDNGFSYPEGEHIKNESTCGFDSEFNMSITPSKGQTEESAKKEEIKLTIHSYTGINPNADISYAFAYSEDPQAVYTDWQKVGVRVESVTKQRNKIAKGETIVAETNSIYTPDNADGNLYLIVRINNLVDLYGESWTNVGDKYKIYGPYRVDNSSPSVDNLEIYKDNGKWRYASSYSDATNFEGYYFVCPKATGNSSCTSKSEFIFNGRQYDEISSYIKFSSNTYDKWGEFCIKVMDYAGNISNKKCNSKTIYKIRLYANDGTNKYKTVDLVLNSSDDKKTNQAILDNLPDERPGYKFLNWSIEKNKNTPAKGDLPFVDGFDKLYAFWEEEKVDISLLNTDPTTGDGYHVTPTANQLYCLPTLTKTGYKFLGWTSRAWNGAPLLGNEACFTPKTTDFYKTYTANWEEQPTVTLSLLEVDPVTRDGKTETVPAGEQYCLPTLKKSGYTFLGWTSRAWNGAPHLGNSACFTPKTTDFYNTYTANWKKN